MQSPQSLCHEFDIIVSLKIMGLPDFSFDKFGQEHLLIDIQQPRLVVQSTTQFSDRCTIPARDFAQYRLRRLGQAVTPLYERVQLTIPKGIMNT